MASSLMYPVRRMGGGVHAGPGRCDTLASSVWSEAPCRPTVSENDQVPGLIKDQPALSKAPQPSRAVPIPCKPNPNGCKPVWPCTDADMVLAGSSW